MDIIDSEYALSIEMYAPRVTTPAANPPAMSIGLQWLANNIDTNQYTTNNLN